MWMTIKDICLYKRRQPEDFAIFHNGLSICCSLIEQNEKKIKLIDPKIVNGCQTVKGIWLKKNDAREEKIINKFDQERWLSIKVPVRIIETAKTETIYEVAINNNRQNGNDSAALRANDEFQRKLKIKLSNRGIFYERQKEEYKNILKENKELLNEEYKNTSYNAPIKIQELAQALAAVQGYIDKAANPSMIFENNEFYKKIFREKKYPISFIIGIFNLSSALGPALKLAKDDIKKYAELNPKTLKWSVLYLTIRCICKDKNEKQWFIEKFSKQTFHPREIKEDILKILKRSGILHVIHEVYIRDQNETTTQALQKAANKLFRREIDIFEGWDDEYIQV
jgi:hypothetical protein